ncbi:enoyl-CoA hydratase [Roseococcus pinisoli]|uniref:Enoyl-CoA hydratase n=1 Tax=Roseococcus pinisoli TaxID=2835040 RepID=A0ABS5Q6U0_9PROT|nr:enoyl-CoA hydratase [Roseococcus pinisoli]MBS7809324.1 enoyl-CoA hydratase [Roseococcus pinisoli]
MSYEMILTETQGRAAIIRLNRPQALNALCDELMAELHQALTGFDADPAIAGIIITGSEKAFAAGADIKQMQARSYPGVYFEDFIANWESVTRIRKPVIAAVAGFALGGGCELAMMCDMIIAAENAKFGQPEINLGIIPGAGGTQRLTRAIGKAKAMDLILTARFMDAAEAERSGLVARVVAPDQLLAEALKVVEKIGSLSAPSVAIAKEAVNVAFETTLTEGVRFERRVFYSLFATEDQKEGMSAFAEKRKPAFTNR